MIRRHSLGLSSVVLALIVVLALVIPAQAYAAQTHVVRPGENLSRIAQRYGTTVQAIMNANGLHNPNYIWVGQRLTIPGGSSGGSGGSSVHVVRRGETLSAIAARYGKTVAAFVKANGLSNPNHIWVGQRLAIPGGGGTGGGTVPSAGTVHVVKRGETLAGIAARYRTTIAAIATANGIRNPNLIVVGQRLKIPTGGSGSGGGAAAPTGGKWIEVDLSSQRTYARQGDAVLRTMVVSTGISIYPTPVGRYRIYAKYPSVAMSGPGYYLPGVPHTMYFYKGYALHGTYWHNNFGHPMSHGCINLKKPDAAWLYRWAPVGTLVVIHW